VFKPLKPLISKELAVFLFHGRVFSKVLPMSRTIEFNTLENSYQSW
jgi:hypothetical protein